MKAFLAIVAALSLAGGGAAYLSQNYNGEITNYIVAPVSKGTIAENVAATGRVRAVVTVDVNSQLAGQITGLFVDFNDAVNKGQRLAQIDQRTFRARLGEARAAVEAAESRVRIQEARVSESRSIVASERARKVIVTARLERANTTLDAAETEFERLEALRSSGLVSAKIFAQTQTERDLAALELQQAEGETSVHEQTINRAEANLRRAKAELENSHAELSRIRASLELAEIELDRTETRSPIDGIVIDRAVEIGQTVSVGQDAQPMFRIARNLEEMEVYANVHEADIGRIRIGQKATFEVDAYPGREFQGSVVQVRRSPQIVNNVVTYTVVIAAPNADLLLLPGMTALVRVVVRETDGDILIVPNSALRFEGPNAPPEVRGNGAVVWVLDGDAPPRAVAVDPGISDAARTEIRGGDLAEGQGVVVGIESAARSRRLFGLRLGF